MSQAVGFIWWFMTQNAEAADKEKMRIRLWVPPKVTDRPIPKESPWSAENETKAFAALKASVGA